MSKGGKIEPRRLKGFRDYLPAVMRGRYRISDAVRFEAELAGFQPVGTPALEYAEILLGQGGEETDKQVYKFTDHGDRQVALRFDLTVPFARFVAEHQGELTFPFKRMQIGDVWRGENTQKGRYREFGQCDLDIIGNDSVAADVEVLLTLARILKRVGFGKFTVAVGHRPVLSALIRKTLGITDVQAETQALIALDKLAKIGADKVREMLVKIPENIHGEAGAAALLGQLQQKTATGDSDLAAVQAFLGSDEASGASMQRLKHTLDLLRQLTADLSELTLRLDLTIARGLGYYTGIVFETTIDALPGFGSICSGGRYNDLASRFTTRELPGVGGSVGLDRLLAALEELNQLSDVRSAEVFVAVATADAQAYAFTIAQAVRGNGMACDIGLGGKLSNQFKHADRLGARFVITVGTDEVVSRTANVKDMKLGTEKKGVSSDQLLQELKLSDSDVF
jgi:histidyl-tRNA synthetase